MCLRNPCTLGMKPAMRTVIGVHKSLPSTVPPRVGKTRTKEPNRLTDAIHPRCPAAHTTAADSEEATPREPRPGPSR